MSTLVHSLSEHLVSTIESLRPIVVRVEARRRIPASGIAWAPRTIVTASHVLQREDGISVGLPGGESVPATLIGRDPATDVAVLAVDSDTLAQPRTVAESSLRVGQLVLALGRTGRTVRAAHGILGTAADAWRTPAGGKIERFLEADITLPAGFSGGPVVDLDGGLIGIATSALIRNRVMVVPAVTLRRVVESLTSRGQVERGYLGIGTQPVRLPKAVAEQSGQEHALLVVMVESDSPAERAGVLLGDAILSFDGARIRHVGDLLERLDEDRVGKTSRIELLRAGVRQDVEVQVGGRGWS
jgi:S1-C subfamily serine protease